MDDRVMTLGCVAAELRRSPRTIRRWIASGKLIQPTHRNPAGAPLWRRSVLLESLSISGDDRPDGDPSAAASGEAA